MVVLSTGATTQVAWLLLDYFDESEHVFQGYVPFNIVRRSRDVSAIASQFQEMRSLSTDIIDRAVGQSPLA
jgi:hypothetical protein